MGCDNKLLLRAVLFFGFVFVAGNFIPAFPQDGKRARVGNSADRQTRQSLSRPEMRIPKLSPQLEQILQNWHVNSKKVKKLEGKHYQFVYNKVFETEQYAHGLFYIENPDKGRIDIEPMEVKAGQVGRRKSKKTGKPYTVKKSHQTKWICDGKQIMPVNNEEKTYEVIPIPKRGQGENIMNGPLPFLFGMPPDKAKLRYHFKLIKETKDQVRLAVKPKWRQDAANWSKATVILDKDNSYLPEAVQLIHPAGDIETVYQFHSLSVNKRKNILTYIWGADPFAKPRYPFKEVKVGPQQNAQRNANAPKVRKGQALVPSVVGMGWEDAKKVITRAGFSVQLKEGTRTKNKKLQFRVERQQPRGRVPFQKGQAIVLTLYNEPLK